MFSLNVPLPPAVDRLADRLEPELHRFDRVRERHTLVCKRLGVNVLSNPRRPPQKETALSEVRSELRPLVRETGPFQVEITGIDAFEQPTTGPGPVVYLVVESEPLVRLHWRLARAFGAVEGIEGDAYVPHVTLARGWSSGSSLEAGSGVEAGSGWKADSGEETNDLETELDRLRAAAGRGTDNRIEITWTIDELDLWDPEFRESAGRIRI